MRNCTTLPTKVIANIVSDNCQATYHIDIFECAVCQIEECFDFNFIFRFVYNSKIDVSSKFCQRRQDAKTTMELIFPSDEKIF